LDSHPNARIAEEQKYIGRWWREKWGRERIVTHLKESGQGKERKLKMLPGSGAWEGDVANHELLLIGDKWGLDVPGLIKRYHDDGASVSIPRDFGKHMGMPVKIIHTIRNPYDNIGSWLESPKYRRQWPRENQLYQMCVRRYARFYGIASTVVAEYPDMFPLYNEELCDNPRKVLTDLCEYLELPVVEPWLTTAADSVFKKPNDRDKITWPPKWEKQVTWRIIDKYPWFDKYKEQERYKRWS